MHYAVPSRVVWFDAALVVIMNVTKRRKLRRGGGEAGRGAGRGAGDAPTSTPMGWLFTVTVLGNTQPKTDFAIDSLFMEL